MSEMIRGASFIQLNGERREERSHLLPFGAPAWQSRTRFPPRQIDSNRVREGERCHLRSGAR